MAQLSVVEELATYGPASRRPGGTTRAEALAYCRRFTREHAENFTVGSWLLPRALQPHFHAIYAFCRWADDLADETDPAASLVLLDWWHDELAACYAARPRHPVFVALASTIEEFSIPIEPFERLLLAFRQDQRQTRYATAADVLAYCENSANPVGRLILYLGRAHDDSRGSLSDSICTGLQLANFCQDVARDWAKGRIYLPAATLTEAGCDANSFASGQCNPGFRRAMQIEVDRAEQYLRRGAALVALMPRELRLEVALFVAGGLSILKSIRRLDYDVCQVRPTVGRMRKLALLLRCWLGTRQFKRREAR